jgi:uncharacterized peroxidase-related enzyme
MKNMNAISRFPVPELKDIPEDLRARMLEVQEKAGFIPNVFLTLAFRPAECRAFFAYHDVLMLKDTPALNKAEREMIVVATSGAIACTASSHTVRFSASTQKIRASPIKWRSIIAKPKSHQSNAQCSTTH